MLRAFLGDIVRSTYDVERYRTLRKKSLPSAIRYFTALSFIISIFVAVGLAPAIADMARITKDDVVSVMPEDTEFTIENGKFSTTLTTPYSQDLGPMILIVDDTFQGNTPPDEDYQHEFAVIVGQDAVFLKQVGNETQVHPFTQANDMTMTRESMLEWFEVNTFTAMLLIIVAFGAVYFLFTLFGVGIFIFTISVFIYYFARLLNARLKYKTWVIIGMHAVTLPLVADLVFNSLLSRLPFLFTMLYLMIIIAVLIDQKSNPVKGV